MSRPLYCDESIWVPVATGLGERGWTVETAYARGMVGETDRDQLAFARERDWLLVTFDDDFLSLVEREELRHEGVLFVQQSGNQVGDVVRAIEAFLEREGAEFRGVGYA